MSDKISVYFVSDGKEWANYLTEKFSCEVYNIETVQQDFHTASADMKTKVNVFLLSPDLAIEDNWSLLEYFDSVTSVAVLTGISHEDWLYAIEQHGIESLNDWYVHELYAEEDSVRDLLLLIISLYEADINAEETYENIPADLKKQSTTEVAPLPDTADVNNESPTEVVPLPDKQRNASVSEENGLETGATDEEANETETVWVLQETVTQDQKNDGLGDYDELPISRPSRPVNPVRYIFRQGEYVYILLEGVNDGLVQLKFQQSGSLVDLACVSEKTTVYTFKHTRIDRETFDVTLDGIEIGYGVIEKAESEEIYDMPRASMFSTSSGSSSLSSRSSNASCDTPPPCSRKPIQTKYVNFSRSCSETPDMQKVRCSSASAYATLEDAAVVSPTRSKSSKLEQIHRLLLEEVDPVNILCQSFQVDSRKHLDEKMASMLQPTGTLQGFPFEASLDATSVEEPSDTDYPTLMHFGAKFNLKIFCQCLLRNPLTRDAALKRNKNGCYPHDVARDEGHTELAEHLENYSRQLRSAKTKSNDSGFSQRVSQSPPSPQPHMVHNTSSPYMDMSSTQFLPPTCEKADSTKNHGSDTKGISKTRQRSILKKTSQESLNSPEEDYEVPICVAREGSVSSTGSTASQEAHGLRVTLGPSIVIDDDKTPVPQSLVEPPLDGLPDYYEDATGNLYNRESNGIESSSPIPINRRISEKDRTNSKNLSDFLGDYGSASAPSESHWHRIIRPGVLGKKIRHIAGMKDKSRTKSDPRLSAEEIEAIHGPAARVGAKTLIHRKDLLESDPTSEQFRPRLQTDPGLIRPKLTLLRNRAAEKEMSSSISDLTSSAVGGIDHLAPPPPCIHSHGVHSAPNSPFQRSKEHHYVKKASEPMHGQSDILLPTRVVKDKEAIKREKKKAKREAKEANKKKIQMTITNAQKRTSMRLIHARKAPVDAAPALPPRPQKMKSLGGF